MNKELQVIKALAELGIDVSPKKNSHNVEEVKARLDAFEKEMGQTLDPEILSKYLN